MLSAVEGLKVVQPSTEHLIIPITAVIIVALFVVQRRGTAAVGRVFGPVMIAWFVTIAACGVVGIVAFGNSVALAYAFGMAVTGTITITTLLFFYVARTMWRTPPWLLASGATLLLAVDPLFVVANLTKLVHGAWLPLLIGLVAFTVMTTWQRGREIVTANRERREGSLHAFVEQLRNTKALQRRVPGTAIFLNRGKETAPLALRANVEHNHVRHQHIVIMSVETELVPRIPADKRLSVDDLGYADDGITHVTARYWYMETPDVPAALRALDPAQTEGDLEFHDASYFLSKIELRKGDDGDVIAVVGPRNAHHSALVANEPPHERP